MNIKIKRLTPNAVIPKYAHGPDEDAGMDVTAVERAVLVPGRPVAVPTGLSFEVPPGYEMQVRPRGGLALKHSITVLNTPGTLDPGYRGQLFVIAMNHGDMPFVINPGDRIAQIVIARYERIAWDEQVELSESERGEGAFASTGISTPL